MKELPVDSVLAQWLGQGPEDGPEYGLNRALAAVHKVDQRPGWTFPRWWLPAPVADVGVRVPRQAALATLLIMTMLALLALAVAFGGRIWPAPLLLAPNEQVIAFADGGVIYVAHPDGSNRQRLSTSALYATTPVFSPDATRVAYMALESPGAGVGRLMIESVDGSSPRVQASQGKAVMRGDVPNFSWSADSFHIAFSAVDGAVARIFVASRDGTEIRPITDGSAQSDLPSWSPVGRWGDYTGDWIAYRVAEADLSEIGFERVHPDGTGVEIVAAVVGPGSSLSKLTWSPEHPDIPGSHTASYAMNAGFGTETRVVIDAGPAHALDIWTNSVGGFADAPIPWSPDSRYLAFIAADHGLIVADDDRTSDVYDGELRELGSVVDCWVNWSPDSRYLYGGAPNGCAGVVVFPWDNPASATTLTNASGTASWRPIPGD